jgi:hypothetical protein
MPTTLKRKAQHKKYQQSPAGIKSMRISLWKSQGIIDEDLGAVYDNLIKETNCMICFKEYKNSKDRCLDHDHETGEIRYICCNYCNRHLLRTEGGCIQTKVSKNNTSGHLNIRYDKERDKWAFSKYINKKRIHIRFHTKEEAVQYKIDNNY